jgi:threonyl-tRNA synthetase
MRITFPNADVREYEKGTNGFEIAKSISESLSREALGIIVNNKQYDLSRPIEEDAEIKILTFSDDEGKKIYWHSSAHLMAEAVEKLFPGAKFGVGPAIENGFYYDVDLPEDKTISLDDLPEIEKTMKELSEKKSGYNRIEISLEDAKKYFEKKGDEYKLELLEGIKDEEITFYQQGDFIDLCRGTHVSNTGVIKYIKLLNVAGAYWKGDSTRKMMTRIYGISFPKKKMLDDYLIFLEEAKKRDHRKLGKELELFIITPAVGSGLPLWLPKGTIIRRKLEEFIKGELIQRGYTEVITPHIGNLNLYRTSGHYPYYADSQFDPIKVENEEYILKPMNCPHHHQIYAYKPRSYRDLPIRLAEFGTVYRYEQSGELSGLTRVRGFTQDDAHIYCTQEQLKDELKKEIDLAQLVFRTFDMDVIIRLSLRDDESEKYAGASESWELAEKILYEVAEETNLDYRVGIGEASFYGPKIDFIVTDAIGRKWQLGTIQVDYVMPERFDLEYTAADNKNHRPVIIHRAPFGSFERFLSILIEHYAGNFPFWIAPVQVNILPIGQDQHNFAQDLTSQLNNHGFRTNIDLRSEKVNRKIAESEQQKIPFALIIGNKEVETNMVSVRKHGVGDIGTKSFDEIIKLFTGLNSPYSPTGKNE